MTGWIAVCLAAALVGVQAPLAVGPEVIADIRVHGNQMTPDDDIVRLSGVMRGDAFAADTIARVRSALEGTHRFRRVDVLKRFVSIEDPSQILIMIVVDEGPVRVDRAPDPGGVVRVVRRRAITDVMFMPMLDGEDGYGLTYGVRVAYVGVTGKRGRLSVPLSWGGHRQAGVEFDRLFVSGPITRVQTGAALRRSINPAFLEPDTRRHVWVRAERVLGPARLAAEGGWQHVTYAAAIDRFRYLTADATFDTRVDPVLPRNAVYANAAWTRMAFGGRAAVDRTRVDGRGYLGLVGQSVLVGRVLRDDASAPLPDYLTSLLGGWSNLRGFAAGQFTGDRLVAGSLELRVPMSSPLNAGKAGISLFVDSGRAYRQDQRFGDVPSHTGVGAGAWVALTAFRAGLSVAHGLGAGTRVNFGLGLTY